MDFLGIKSRSNAGRCEENYNYNFLQASCLRCEVFLTMRVSAFIANARKPQTLISKRKLRIDRPTDFVPAPDACLHSAELRFWVSGSGALAIGAYRASDAGSIVGVRFWGLLRQGPSTFGCGFGCEVVSSGLDRCGCELDAEYFSCAGVGVVLVRRRLCILLYAGCTESFLKLHCL